ncbi:mechanosensitive ion channel family protein [Lishizhenia sp.]|uniref:mechanosensitive ion channel family protein n=1 Tax=Lishizhenia sp. TaxID=2497594 RepID=UPI00299D61D4|nr:mechanosensitive ion channel domain-containing protein [Lishizhenia sp.]MDX1445197.1 mechanosensitive ion channel [Lishizhenia sp.]
MHFFLDILNIESSTSFETVNEILGYDLLSSVENYSLKIIDIGVILIIFAITLVLLKLIRRIIEKPPKKTLAQEEFKRRHSIYLLVKYFVWVISIVIMLDSVGIKVSVLLAGSAALLVGVGMGLQNIFSDFVSGVFLLFEGTIKVKEIIEVDGIIGQVEEINLRNSKLITRENVTIIIPNSKFVTEKVINWSHNHGSVRFMVDIGVAYGSDVEEVIDILEQCMSTMNEIEKNPKPFVRFKNFGDSSLDFELIFWTRQAFTVDNLKSNLRIEIYKSLAKNNISIPFPQRDLHIIEKKEN